MSDLMAAGVELMMVGMGTVFSFLTLLVFATTLMSALVSKFVSSSAPVAASDPVASEEELAAIGAAVHRHRARRTPKK